MSNTTQKVTTRSYSFRSEVLKKWGPEYNKPDVAYRFSNGRTFDSTDRATSGIYKK